MKLKPLSLMQPPHYTITNKLTRVSEMDVGVNEARKPDNSTRRHAIDVSPHSWSSLSVSVTIITR